MLSKGVAKLLFAQALCGFLVAAEAPATNLAGRVLVVEHSGATVSFTPQREPIQRMFREGLLHFTGKSSVADAWRTLVSTQDTIGLKIHSAPGRLSGTRPAVLSAVIESLLEAGISPGKIVIWDRRMVDLRLAGFSELAERHGVQIAAAQEEGYDQGTFYPSSILGRLVFSDLEFDKKGEGVGRNSFVTRLLTTRITKIINVTPLLNHNLAGVSGALHGLVMSSVDNTLRFEEPERLAVAIPEIFAMPELYDRLALNIVDALLCQYRGEERSYLQYSSAMNQLWFSQDAVAVDALAIQELNRRRPDQKTTRATLQIYDNAELMDLGIANTNRIRIERLDLK